MWIEGTGHVVALRMTGLPLRYASQSASASFTTPAAVSAATVSTDTSFATAVAYVPTHASLSVRFDYIKLRAKKALLESRCLN
jgi:hypothetical protein